MTRCSPLRELPSSSSSIGTGISNTCPVFTVAASVPGAITDMFLIIRKRKKVHALQSVCVPCPVQRLYIEDGCLWHHSLAVEILSGRLCPSPSHRRLYHTHALRKPRPQAYFSLNGSIMTQQRLHWRWFEMNNEVINCPGKRLVRSRPEEALALFSYRFN